MPKFAHLKRKNASSRDDDWDEPAWHRLPKFQIARISEALPEGVGQLVGRRDGVPVKGLSVRFKANAGFLTIYPMDRPRSQEQIFKLITNNVEGVPVLGIICEFTGNFVDELFKIDGSFVSKPAMRSAKAREQLQIRRDRQQVLFALRARPGPERKQDLITKLRDLGAGDNEEAAKRLASADRHDRAAARRAASARLRIDRLKDDPLGMWCAIREGRRANVGKAALAARFSGRIEAALEAAARGVSQQAYPRLALESHPRLDIRRLHADPDLWRSGKTYARLAWATALSADLYVDLDHEMPHVAIRPCQPPGAPVQVIWVHLIEVSGRKRPYFLCQISGLYVEVLAWRDGMFASAKVLGLTHRSQLGSRKSRKPTTTARKRTKKTPKRQTRGTKADPSKTTN